MFPSATGGLAFLFHGHKAVFYPQNLVQQPLICQLSAHWGDCVQASVNKDDLIYGGRSYTKDLVFADSFQ